jgi:sugar phosphate isomerase/epimerase
MCPRVVQRPESVPVLGWLTGCRPGGGRGDSGSHPPGGEGMHAACVPARRSRKPPLLKEAPEPTVTVPDCYPSAAGAIRLRVPGFTPKERWTVEACLASALVLNPDELGPDPVPGMDLAVKLGIGYLEIRSVRAANVLMLPGERLRHLRALADVRGLKVAALASPLWKWCRPEACPGRVDTFGFPTQVPLEERLGWVERAIAAAGILDAPIVRVFSHLRVAPGQTERFTGDPLLAKALEMADRAGVRLLLENEPVCTVARAGPLLEVLERYHGQGLGLWLDVANLHEVGQATGETVMSLAPYVGYVHVKDYRAGAAGGRVFCPAGEGCVPYGEVLPLLHAACPVLPYALETHVRDTPAEALTAGAAFLRSAVPGGLA